MTKDRKTRRDQRSADAEDPVEIQVSKELAGPVAPDVLRATEDVVGRIGPAAVAVLFYGSCLRSEELENKVLDFYVLVDSYSKAYGKGWLAMANALLPPNVFYAETEGEKFTLRTKYAVLSVADFRYGVSSRCLNSSIWARFAQPCRLVWSRDERARLHVVKGVADAVTTIVYETAPLMARTFLPDVLWSRAFSETYRVELRSEKKTKGRTIYEEYGDRYDRILGAVLDRANIPAVKTGKQFELPPVFLKREAWRCHLTWFLRRVQGKSLSLMRLIKAASTFDGGIDYLAWKISRHSGIEITVSPWQRRHPVIAGLLMFWTLRRKGAFR